MFMPPPIPDLGFASVSKAQLVEQHGERMQFINNVKLYPQSFFDTIRPAGAPGQSDFSQLYIDPNNQIWENLKEFKNIDQGHKAWMDARTSLPLNFSASNMWKYLCMGHSMTAARIGVSEGMTSRPSRGRDGLQYDETWHHIYLKSKDLRMPAPPNDVMSAVFMRAGVINENSVLDAFLHTHQEYNYSDQGSTYLLPEIMQRSGLLNLVTNEPIRSLPFIISASPDGILKTETSNERITCEWKAATMFLPCTNSARNPVKYPGVEFFYNPKAAPYDKPKHYYKPQIALQQLCCETNKTFFGCWTLTKGMNVWQIQRDQEYINMMFTIILHLFETFMNDDRQGRVPINYLNTDELGCPVAILNLYERFIQRTIQFGDVEKEVIPVEKCQEAIRKTLGVTPVPRRDIRFPNTNKGFAPYHSYNLYLHMLSSSGNETGVATWIDSPRNTLVRTAHIDALRHMDTGVLTATEFLEFAIQNVNRIQPPNNLAAPCVGTHPWFQMDILEKKETYLSHVIGLVAPFFLRLREREAIRETIDYEQEKTKFKSYVKRMAYKNCEHLVQDFGLVGYPPSVIVNEYCRKFASVIPEMDREFGQFYFAWHIDAMNQYRENDDESSTNRYMSALVCISRLILYQNHSKAIIQEDF